MSFVELIGDRQYVGQFSNAAFGLEVHKSGLLADADGNAVTATLTNLDGTVVVFTGRAATHAGAGLYEVLLSSVETQNPGLWKLTWTYALNGIPQTFVGLLEVGVSSPQYDSLSPGFKGVIESVMWRFADLFDSPLGGPHLQVYFQTRWSRGRAAQMLQAAVGKLNSIAQPHMTYTIDEATGPFPYQSWGPLLEQGLYIEVIKHLIRSYVEQPLADGVTVPRLDRRDYMNRWKEVLDMEMADYTAAMEVFKIANMGLGRPRVLVSGGVYGNFGPTRSSHSAAARPRYWARFYVVLLILSLGWQVALGSKTSPITSGPGSIAAGVQTIAGPGCSPSIAVDTDRSSCSSGLISPTSSRTPIA